MEKPVSAIHLLYCYARKDSRFRDELEAHLEPIVRSGIAITWHDRKILAGEDWQQAIHSHLDQADLILLLISPSFMRSNYCYGVEMQRALERHELGTVSVIPIIVRPTDWQRTPLGRLQALPRDGKPVILWRSRDEAFKQIAQEVYTVILQRLSEDRHQKGYWMRLGHVHLQAERYQQALHAYRQAGEIDPKDAIIHRLIGEVLIRLEKYDEALSSFELSLCLIPQNATLLHGKANVLLHLRRYEEALICYQLILDQFQATPDVLCGKGHALFALRRYEEALDTYEQAITLFPGVAYPYHYKGIVLMHLERYEEAFAASQQALARNPHESSFYLSTARILDRLGEGRQEEASVLHDMARLYEVGGDDVILVTNFADTIRHTFDVGHEWEHSRQEAVRTLAHYFESIDNQSLLQRLLHSEDKETLE